MGERNHNNAVVALNEGKLVTKSALRDDVASATNRARYLMFFDFALEELL